MADALLSVVIEQLALPLHEKLKKEIKLVFGAPKDVEKLHETFDKISCVLDDAERRHIQNVLRNMETRDARKAPESFWLENLKDIFYQMEEVLDEWHTENKRQLEVGAASDGVDAADKGKKAKAWACFMPCSCIKKVTFDHKIGSRIQKLKQQLDLLVIEKNKYDFKKSRREEENHVQDIDDERRTISKISTSSVYGRDAEKEKVISMLLAESNQDDRSVPVISIIGMGGIGKTTLAQYVFNDDKVKDHFQKKMWVCVSEPFDRIRLAKAIIEAAGDVVRNVDEWEAWHTQLCQCLEGKRFLLVLDDVWTEDQPKWNHLKCALDLGQIGSKILVTTRNERVADTVGSLDQDKHSLQQLSDDECWSLFERLAFTEKEKSEHQLLKDVGRKISNKCKGVPLYANSLGSSMARTRKLEKWEEVLASDIWDLSNVNKYIFAPLLLSYKALPPHLKRCFTYCAVFPKDTEIKKDTLIKMWMAEGCLRSRKETSLESIGEEYFDELVMRSFFQELQPNLYGDVVSCKMHDLLHDLATFLGNNECLVYEPKGIRLNNLKLRHLYVQRSSKEEMDGSLNSIWTLKSLRTLLVSSYRDSSLQDWAEMRNLTCLRTLDLSWARITKLPKAVEKLIHLRYLNLRYTKIWELPKTITNLINLQTLDLNGCFCLHGLPNSLEKLIHLRYLNLSRTCIKELPETVTNLINLQTLDLESCFCLSGLPHSLGKLVSLRHLNLSYCEKIKELPHTITNLIYLQTLNLNVCKSLGGLPNSFGKLDSLRHLHIIGCNFSKGLPRGIGKLRDLRMLSNFIVSEEGCDLVELKDLNNLHGYLDISNIRGIGDEARGVMKNKKYLHRLELIFCSESEGDDLKALELLEAHSDLKELNIFGYKGSKFPSWMEFRGARQKPIMLRRLDISGCSKLKVLPALAELQFLEYLKLEDLESVAPLGLEVLDDAVSFSVEMSAPNIAFQKLKKLEIYNMNKWEELVIVTTTMNKTFMPCLQTLIVRNCPMLKSLPCQLLSSSSLRQLQIYNCPNLVVVCLPLSLEWLSLKRDAGSLSKSLPVESGLHTNLKCLQIYQSEQSTLPEGVSQLTGLQTLKIENSPILAARCKKGEGEDWNIISHIPNIEIMEYQF